jgi:adenylyl cyclase-associated protein
MASSAIELPQGVPALQQTLASPQSGVSTAPSAPTPAATPAPPPAEPLPESIEEFDAFIKTSIGKFATLSKGLGGLIAEQAAKVVEGFQKQRRFLLITTKAKKPDFTGSEMAVYQDLLKPINECLIAVNDIKDGARGSPVFHQLSAVSDGIMVLAWVTVDNRPYKHVEESLGSVQFFGNRVLKEHKDKFVDQFFSKESGYDANMQCLETPNKSNGSSPSTKSSATSPNTSKSTSRTASPGTPTANQSRT